MPHLHCLTRDADLRAADRVPHRLLDAVPDLSHAADDDGLLVPFYAGRLKCTYIDPPYNTRSAFENYDDRLEYAKWLAMIVPRLMLLREFLSEDGSIWVSIDDNGGHYLKVVMDELFGRRNLLDTIISEKADPPRTSARQFASDHDYILVFSKNKAIVYLTNP